MKDMSLTRTEHTVISSLQKCCFQPKNVTC